METIQSENKVLIVDDSHANVCFIRDILKNDYTVEVAYSGEEALRVIHEFVPDLILLDIVMPGIDGYEVCRRIRNEESLRSVKIIVVSTKKSLEERLEGYMAGADDYVVKGFETDEFLAKVKVFLRLKSVEDQLSELNSSLNSQVKLRTEQLIKAETMAALGRHTVGIVHNLKNPLQVIMGWTELLSMRNPDNKDISSLRKASLVMMDMIGTILITGRKGITQNFAEIDLNEVIGDQVDMLRSSGVIRHNIKMEVSLGVIPGYMGVYSHFSQSLGNLINNAVEAMHESENGILSISSYSDEKNIVIRICDNGPGIPKKYMRKIFDPFFSTKPMFKDSGTSYGTGLGLPSSKEMIECYGGSLVIDSEEGVGTVCEVTLPLKKTPS